MDEEEYYEDDPDGGYPEPEPPDPYLVEENYSWRGEEEAAHHSWERRDNCVAGKWSDETDSNISYEDDLGHEEELETEPLDHTWSNPYPNQQKSKTMLTYEFDIGSDDESPVCEFSGGRRGDLPQGELRNTIARGGKLYHSPSPDQAHAHYAQSYKTKIGLSLNSRYKCFEPELFLFSGTEYLQWESSMDKYFQYHSIPSKEKLSVALEQLIGKARTWWNKEDYERRYYKEPKIRTWEELKWVMCKRYEPQELLQSHQLVSPSKKAKQVPLHTKSAPTHEHVHLHKPREGLSKTRQQGKVRSSQISNAFTCYKCNSTGHLAKDCPRKKALTTIGNGKELRVETHLTFKEEISMIKSELNKCQEQLISMIKHSSCPEIV